MIVEYYDLLPRSDHLIQLVMMMMVKNVKRLFTNRLPALLIIIVSDYSFLIFRASSSQCMLRLYIN